MCFIGFGDLGCQFYDVKHSKNDKSITKTSKNWLIFDVSEIGFSFSLFFMPKRHKNEPIPGSPGSCPRTAARHLPNTRRGQGWREFTSKLPQISNVKQLCNSQSPIVDPSLSLCLYCPSKVADQSAPKKLECPQSCAAHQSCFGPAIGTKNVVCPLPPGTLCQNPSKAPDFI